MRVGKWSISIGIRACREDRTTIGRMFFTMTTPLPMTADSGYGIEFDNYENDLNFPDPSGNHIALIEDSVGNHLNKIARK